MPESGSSVAASIRNSVVFPVPLAPMMATNSPGATEKVVGWRIVRLPIRFATSQTSRRRPTVRRLISVRPSKTRRYGPMASSEPGSRAPGEGGRPFTSSVRAAEWSRMKAPPPSVLEHSVDGRDGWVIEDHVAVVPASDHQAVVIRAAAPNRRQQPLGAVGDEHVPPRYRDPVAAAQAARPACEYLAVDEQPDTADILDAHRAVGSTRDHGVAVCGARGIDPQPGVRRRCRSPYPCP